MFEVTYTMESTAGSRKIAKRVFTDEDMAQSEKTFQPGRRLKDGTLIKAVSVVKMKKSYKKL